uniref:Uncharacterized protein n=1 Tax=Anguilla anguilla TaxID=7936 RepID=A0A0E9VDJ3_ANGAN
MGHQLIHCPYFGHLQWHPGVSTSPHYRTSSVCDQQLTYH